MGCERSLGRNQSPRPMKTYPIPCNHCNKVIYRDNRRINEAKRFGWKTYCSTECHSRARNKSLTLVCSNPSCGYKFTRQPHSITNLKINYCSRTCAVTINNSKFPKRHALVKNCRTCNKQFKGNEKYCSISCKSKSQVIARETVLSHIRNFYKRNGRIPFKNEYAQAKAARLRFGSWNKAITAAGFTPNPVKFAKKFIAKDGHVCDSLAEKIIDDWLLRKNIKHERQIPYPTNSRLTADFSIGNYFIEFFGLFGHHKRYNELRNHKLQIVKNYKIKLIEIYPKDLFPKNKLQEILKF